ncbi:GxxExxY protein [Myxococcota bacterium]|nr:GxxExxY protein [Myxococcota bacterium]
MIEPDAELDALARATIGAAIEVHRTLGPGFGEGVYEQALSVELELRGIPHRKQAPVEVYYKGVMVGFGKVDIVVGERLPVELKTVDQLHGAHRAQLISYLKALETPLGLLLNFRASLMKDGIERVVWSR